MDLHAFKILSAAVLLVVALIGGFLPRKISKISPVAVHIANSFAGGILIAVAMVHMLPDAADGLTDAGKTFNKELGGDDGDAFPVANALFVIGFLFIVSLEALMSHNLSGHARFHSGTGEQELLNNEQASNAGGWAAVVGLSVHSVIEGVAAGAGDDNAQVGAIMLAIACHKGFAAFAMSSANLPLLTTGRRCVWIALVLWFASSGSIGIIIGMAASDNLDGPGSASITALAAGTLLSVGISEMIVPAFSDKRQLGWKLAMAATSGLAMMLLAVWA